MHGGMLHVTCYLLFRICFYHGSSGSPLFFGDAAGYAQCCWLNDLDVAAIDVYRIT